jgi:hypothetical protein
VFSCSESEQKQLNTWVSFQSAEQPLLGQFSVSGNSLTEKTASIDGSEEGRLIRRRSGTYLLAMSQQFCFESVS